MVRYYIVLSIFIENSFIAEDNQNANGVAIKGTWVAVSVNR